MNRGPRLLVFGYRPGLRFGTVWNFLGFNQTVASSGQLHHFAVGQEAAQDRGRAGYIAQ